MARTIVPRVFRPVPNCTMCEIRWGHDSNQFENTMAYKWAGSAPTSAQLLSLATEVRDTIGVKLQQMISSGAKFREVHCYNMDVAAGNQATALFPSNATGTRGGDPLPANAAMNVVKRTGQRGRSSHGAMRVSDFSEGDVTGNTLQNYLLTAGANLVLSIIAARVGGQFQPGVRSLLHQTVGIILSGIVLDPNVDSQKTRLNNHGN